jgi:NAD+ synthase (glutamine-hydrolysing)
MQKIWNTLVEGIKFYCEENSLNDVVFGLSGGLDSALVAALSCEALGKNKVHAVVMPSRFSSSLSIQITKQMQEIYGFDMRTFDIQPITDLALKQAKDLFNENPNLAALENVQARIRGPIVLGLMGNQFGYLPLCCSNKSEALLGYATFGGDTFGGFAPIANLYKTQIFELAAWRNSQTEAFPKEVITRAPSAELSENQTDEKSLNITYILADSILAMQELGKTEKQIADMNFASEKQISHVFNLVRKNAFKRYGMPTAVNINAPLAKSVQTILPDFAIQEYINKFNIL